MTSAVVATAVPFVWFGMVLAISFLEAPLKFRAPGITRPLGLGIGRLVFRALNTVEILLALLLIAASALTLIPALGWLLLVGLVALLAVQILALRPRLDRRILAIIRGQTPPRSRQHLLYLALEGVKALALPLLGIVIATSVLK